MKSRHRPGSLFLLCASLLLVSSFALYGLGCTTGTGGEADIQNTLVNFAALEGDVYDLETGRLLGGATLVLDNGLHDYSTSSDATGHYEFTRVEPGAYRLTFGLLGYQTSHESLVLGGYEHAMRDVGLDTTVETGGIVGRVLRYNDGAPPTVPLTGVLVSLDYRDLTTTTDNDGFFVLEDLPAGFNTFGFELDGYRETQAVVDIPAGALMTMDFELLDRAGIVRGLVSDSVSGIPLAGVLVSIPDLEMTTITSALGTYEVTGVSSGTWFCSFEAASYDALHVTTSVRNGGTTTLDVELASSYATVWGVVEDEGGNALSDVLVSIPTSGLTTLTDGFGRYLFPGTVRTGSFVAVGAEKAGYVTSGTYIPGGLAPDDTAVVDFILVASVGDITGVVRNSVSLSPVAGAVCTIPYLGASVVTNASGVYSFSSLSPGLVPVRVSAAGYGTITTSVPVVAGTVTITDILVDPI